MIADTTKTKIHKTSKPYQTLKIILLIYGILSAVSFFYLAVYFKKIHISSQVELWLSLVYGYWVCCSFILAQVGIGNVIFKLPFLRNSDLLGIPLLMFSFGAGFYISNCFLTLVAIFKWINGFGIFIYVLICIPVIIFGLKAINDSILLPIRAINISSNNSIKNRWLFILLIILWVLPYFLQTFLPNTDWDGAWQHLPLPKLFLEKGISWVTPGFMQFDFPGAVHLVYSLFFFLKAESAIIPFNFIIALGIVASVYYFADHFFGKYTARWAAAVTAAINIMWEVSLTPRIDSFLAFFCFLGVYAFLLWIQNSKKTGLLIVTGMTLGVAMGIKYTALLFLPVLSLVIIIHSLLNSKIKSVIKFTPLLLTVVVLVIPSGWWYARNAIKLGDPVYPFISDDIFYDNNGNKIKLQPALQKHIENMPSRENIESVFTKTGLDVFLDWEDNSGKTPDRRVLKYWRNGLFNGWDIIINPDKYSRKPYHEINPFLFLFILLPFFDRSKISLYLYIIGAFFFASIATKTHILRYALPAFPLISVGASRVLSKIRSKKLIVVSAILLAACLIRFSFFETKKLIEMKPLAYLSGSEERIDWLETVGYNWDRTTPPFIKFVNQQINNGLMTKEDIIFMIGEGKGNLLKCSYLPDSSRSARPWLEELIKTDNDYSRIAKSLKERGVSYLAINYFYLYWSYSKTHYDTKPLIFGLYHLQRFLEMHTEIVYNENGMVLAKIIK